MGRGAGGWKNGFPKSFPLTPIFSHWVLCCWKICLNTEAPSDKFTVSEARLAFLFIYNFVNSERTVLYLFNKMWYIHTIKYDLALKKKEILQYATTWMNLEDMMLSEISQSQKDKCVNPLA